MKISMPTKWKLGAIACLFFCLSAPRLQAAMRIDPARVRELAQMLPAQPVGVGRPITDRAAWDNLRRHRAFASLVNRAEALAREPVPALPEELYLDYSRTGNRTRCERVLSARTSRIASLTMAECLEDQGRFIQPLAKAIEAVCSERTWVYPAHDGKLDNFYGRRIDIDLRASAVGWELATVDYLLGDKLPAATRRLIRANVGRRVLQPFRDMVLGRRPELWWMRVRQNWNAVCLSGVVGSALALENSPDERAWFVAAGEKYIRFFLSGFTPDGYCSEGIGYWNYGFGHFLLMSEAIRQATSGGLDLLADPAALQPALYSLRTEILNGIYPSIADCHPGSRPDPQFVRFICARFGLRPPHARGGEFVSPSGGLVHALLFSFLPRPLPRVPETARLPDTKLRTWFEDGGVLICRPTPGSETQFAVALKGGNNDENHNHNDVGSFSVVAGSSMVICDPGGEVYTARTFSAHRYDSKVINSYGHAVPVVAGQLQRTGKDAKAAVLRTDFQDGRDTLALDIRSAYAVPQLKKLERTFTFRRAEPASLTVRDRVRFTEPESFEEALITWGTCRKVSRDELEITDDKGAVGVKIDSGGLPFNIHDEIINENVPTPKKPRRIGIGLAHPVKDATITLRITPR